MATLNLDAVERIISEVAAIEIMPRFRKLLESDIEMKGINDPVTVADKAAEKALTVRLTDTMPGSVVVGEESFAADPAILSHFGGQQYVWVIDPIDGTRNFISGTPEFGVMVALVKHKQTVASWIHDPNTNGTLKAEQGGGVWLGSDKMQLAGKDKSIPSVNIVGARLQKLLAKPQFAADMAKAPAFESGSAAAFDYGRLFTGPKLFGNSNAARAAYLLYRHSKPWDHVPGLFMVAEAGGYSADLRGNPYDMETGLNGLLVSPAPEGWIGIHKAFKPAIDAFLNRRVEN